MVYTVLVSAYTPREAVCLRPTESPSGAAAEERRRVRIRKGWNQQQLADRLSELGAPTDRATISKIETGDRRITLDEVFWFAYALGVSPAALMLPRSFGSRVAVTPTDSIETQQAMDWLRGAYLVSHPENESDDPFFLRGEDRRRRGPHGIGIRN